jgi:hypothetical protein
LSFDIKGNSFSGGTFTVQISADGETYTDLSSYTKLGDTQTEIFDLDEDIRYIKWIYTTKVNGNVGLGNIVVIAPEDIVVSFNKRAEGYSTLYYGDKNLVIPDGVKAYTYSVVGGELIVNNTYEADDIIPAGTGVVLEASAGDYSFTVSEEGGLSDDGNMLRGSDEAEEVSDADYTYYILSDGTKGIGFYYGKKDGKDSPHAISNAAHKAYLAVPNEQTGAKTGFAFSMLADAISTAVISEQPAPVYNLQGQRVSNAQLKPGIYVSNGRKFIVR